MGEQKRNVVKATLSTGRTVILAEMKISTTEKAAKMVAQDAGDSQNVMVMLMPKAILSLILLQVDGEKVTMAQKNDMDSLFTLQEYNQLLKVVGKMNGSGDDKGEAQVEFVAGL